MHYYKFNIADYRKDTAHLSPIEHYIYRSLMDWYYLDEKPIPKKTQVVIRRLGFGSIGLLENTEMLENVLNDFFIETDNGFEHKRIAQEILEYEEKGAKNRQNGKLGGRPKGSKQEPAKPKITQVVNSDNPSESEPNPNHKPLTTNHKPITNSKEQSQAISAKASDIFDYWVKVMSKTGNVTFSDKRKKSVKDRLKDGYSVEDIKKAIDNCSVTPWNSGSNPQNKRFDDLELICRTGEKLEQFRDNDPLENKKVDAHSGFDKRDYSVGATDESITDRW